MRQNWLDWCTHEVSAATNASALFDESHQAKILVQGPDAASLLSRVCANSLDMTAGSATSAIWLNDSGRIVSLPRILNLGEAGYLLLTSPMSQRRDPDWLKRHIASGETVSLIDMTAAWTILHVVGPDASTLLARAARRADCMERDAPRVISVG